MTKTGTIGMRYPKAKAMTAKQLKALRHKKGWTQEILAEALRVTASTVRKWEQGVHAISPAMERLIAVTLLSPLTVRKTHSKSSAYRTCSLAGRTRWTRTARWASR